MSDTFIMHDPNVLVEACVCCGGRSFSHFEEFRHMGTVLSYVICRGCALVFMNPRFDESDLRNFYKSTYRETYCGSTSPTRENIAEQRERAKHLSGLIGDVDRRIESHLDIGCSAGLWLDGVKEDHGIVRSVGIEPADDHRSFCASKGHEVYPSFDTMMESVGTRFDLITISHVLEHLVDPVDFLIALRAGVISPRGLLLVEVPNLYAHECYEVAHLFAFSKRTLYNTCRLAGFEIIKSKIHGIPRRQKNSRRYISVLASPSTVRNHRSGVQKRLWRFETGRRFIGRAFEGYSVLEGLSRAPGYVARRLFPYAAG